MLNNFNLDENIELSNIPRVKKVDDWIRIIRNERLLYIKSKPSIYEVIKFFCDNNIESIIAHKIQELMQLKKYALNGMIVGFGKRVIELLGIESQYRDDGDERLWNIMFTGRYIENRYFEYTIRPEVIEAYKKVK